MKFSATLVVAPAALLLATSCGPGQSGAPNPANAPIPVSLYTVVPEKATSFDVFPGTVVARMQVDIKPEVEGFVTGMFFTEGGHVSKGQKLYEIDNSKYGASKNQAEANLKVAQSNLEQAQKDADRYIYLNEHEAIAKQTLDHAMTTLQNAKDQVVAARQDLVKAQTDLSYAYIRAPFDGTIGISQVKVGNAVSKEQTILNTISTDDPMAVDFTVPEKQIKRFAELKQYAASDSVFSLLLPDNSIYPKPGKIMFMDRGVNPQTGTITVRLEVPNNGQLKAGMSCNVRVKSTDTSLQLLIPGRSIVEQMGEYFVFVERDTLIAPQPGSATAPGAPPAPTAPSPHAVQKRVTVGATIGDKIVIKSGLTAGERVIADGVQRMRDGAEVNLGGPQKANSNSQH